jgi:hypothetical protein
MGRGCARGSDDAGATETGMGTSGIAAGRWARGFLLSLSCGGEGGATGVIFASGLVEDEAVQGFFVELGAVLAASCRVLFPVIGRVL